MGAAAEQEAGVKACTIRVRGQVQGVGFRPFVWQLAQQLGLVGSVCNDAGGVLVSVQGKPQALERFVHALAHDAPPLARVQSVEVEAAARQADCTGFEIAHSQGGRVATGIAADAATCPACLAEIFDPADRRHGYAFGNCTHCGPRLTIIEAVPYDRSTTSMAAFTMCEACAGEYDNPADRRFHAQPIACPDCGPRLWLEGDGDGQSDPLHGAASLLRAGRIVAIKGLGGFHLACLARDEKAVSELRRRKARDAKPFALMVRSVEDARAICTVSPQAAALLQGAAAPIVLLPRREDANLPDTLAPENDHLGVMLAYSPLHHLLLDAVGEPLVMTSGNRSDEPQVVDNAQARAALAGLADAWLMHDRDIVNRVDDSVVALDRCGPVALRRARGMAPDPVILPESLAADVPILAMGGELKATFCLLRGREAVLSQHIGDLEDAEALLDYRRMLDLFRRLYDFTPGLIAVDRHADYLSTQAGRRLGRELGVPVLHIDHHHAHMASCMAENGIAADAGCHALVADGLGLGGDGTLWGGEAFAGTYASVTRTGALPAVPLPGGGAAMKQPWRNLMAHLVHAFGADWHEVVPGLLPHLPDAGTLRLVEAAMAQGLNSPACSSAGRLFDAVAAALGVHAAAISHEGQAAMALEALARPFVAEAAAYPFAMAEDAGGIGRPDLSLMWLALAQDLANGTANGMISARFHRTASDILVQLLPAEACGTVALSGGVFQNRILRELVVQRLEERGLTALVHRAVPAGDGGLSLGQAAVAAARVRGGEWAC